jgi:hypothetical protein
MGPIDRAHARVAGDGSESQAEPDLLPLVLLGLMENVRNDL